MRFGAALLLAVLGLGAAAPAARAELKIGIVFDKGGKDDRSFNAAAYRGVERAEKELGAKVKFVEATDDNAFVPMLRSLAQKDFDLIVSVGVSQRDALARVAGQFPTKHFAAVDAQVDVPNVRSLVFEEQEGSYLVGALSALSSKTGTIGFIGGMDIPLIRRFEMGFDAGAKKVKPAIKILSNYVGVTGDAWNNPAKSKELAVSQYGSGADVIFAAAGASNGGVFDAAEEKKKLACGCDSNQNWIKPGFILTSMLKKVDVAVFDAAKDVRDGKFTGGIKQFGLASDGVGFALDEYNRPLIPAPVLKKVEDLKAQIIAGKIQVPDYYKKK